MSIAPEFNPHDTFGAFDGQRRQSRQVDSTRGGRVLRLPDAAERQATRKAPPPLSAAMIGSANDISVALSLASMPSNQRQLIELIRRLTHGNAGRQRQFGYANPGTSCTFNLAEWAEHLGWHKSQLIRVRDRLVADHTLFYTPDPSQLGCGTISFNLAFDEWKSMDKQHTANLYRRAHSGRKPKHVQQENIDNRIPDEAVEHRHLDCTEAINHRQPDSNSGIPVSMVVSIESASSLGAATPLRKREKKEREREETDTSVSGVSAAPSAPRRLEMTSNTERATDAIESMWLDADVAPFSAATPEPRSTQRPSSTTLPTQASRDAPTPNPAPPPPSAPMLGRGLGSAQHNGGKSVAAKSAKPRKLSDEDRPAHNARMQYVRLLIEAYKVELNVKGKLPGEGQHSDAARWFYTACDGAAVPRDEVIEWYRVQKRAPFWSGKLLPLVTVAKQYVAHQGNLEAFRHQIEQEVQRYSAARNIGSGSARFGGNGYGRAPNEPGPLQRADRVKWPKGWE